MTVHRDTKLRSLYSTTAVAQRCRHNEAGAILRRLCHYHPKPVSRNELMLGAGILGTIRGPVSACASFHWHVERINDELREFGWEVVRHSRVDETYRLERLL
jgi:hypothetical protein